MRSTALAFKDEYDEVPVSSQQVLEVNVAAIRADLNELKTDFRAAFARIDQDIKTAVSKLEGEIRAASAKAERELQQFATRIETQIAEMRGEDKALRDKGDRAFETLNAKIDKNHEWTTAQFTELGKTMHSLSTRVSVLIWFVGLLGTIILGAVSVGKALNWF